VYTVNYNFHEFLYNHEKFITLKGQCNGMEAMQSRITSLPVK